MILPNFFIFLYSRDKNTVTFINTDGDKQTESNNINIARMYGNGSSIALNGEYKNGLDYFKNTTSDNCGIALYLGSGSTKPTENDYTLESPISVSDLPITIGHVDMQTDIDKFMIVSITVQNVTDHNITVSELGLFDAVRYSGIDLYMLAREVLDTPVIMEPNDIKTFTMVIK